MNNKTKSELIKLVEELKEKIEQLENDVDYWQSEYDDMSEQLEKAECQIEDIEICNGIKDINNFIFELRKDNLYSRKIEEFINNYLKFYN